MSEKIRINIRDFNLFYELTRTISKMSDGVKMTVGNCGLTIYAKNAYSKCELTSNSIDCEKDISFCIKDLNAFFKLLTTAKNIYESDLSNIGLFFETPFLKIESKKFKTKLSTVDEENISRFIGTKVHTQLTPRAEFTTNTNLIKNINSHSFLFNDSSEPRIYLSTNSGENSEMENNTVFAKIGNDANELANYVTLELGLLNYGDFGEEKIILDFDRLNILNMVPSDEIKVQLAKERPVLISNIKRTGTDGTFYNVNIYSFMMVK